MCSRFALLIAGLWLLAGCATIESGARTADRAIGDAVGWLTGAEREEKAGTAEATLDAPSPPPVLEPASGSFRTRTDVRLRVGPGTRYRILAVLPADSRVIVLGRVAGRDWVKVRAPAGEGYVARGYLEPLAEGSGEDRLPTAVDSGG